MTVVSINKGSKYLWFIFLCPLAYLYRDFAFKLLFSIKFINHPLIETAIMFLGEMLAGAYQLTSLLKEEKRAYTISDTIKIRERTSKLSIKPSKIVLLVLLSSFIDFITFTGISYLCQFESVEKHNIHTEMRITPIFFMSILSNKFFHFEIYKHHKIAIIFVGIGYCFICIDRLFQLLFQPQNDFHLYFLLMFLAIHSINSIKQINDKYIIDQLFVSPFILLLYQGITGFFFCLISISLISCFHITFFKFIKNENFTDIIGIYQPDESKIIFLYFGILLINSRNIFKSVSNVNKKIFYSYTS